MDKWFSVQASAPLSDTLDRAKVLMGHKAFSMKNPNRVRALIGAFAGMNPICFHAADGRGYRFLADRIIELNRTNPQIAARLAGNFSNWRRHEPGRQELMRAELQRLAAVENISRDVFEVVSKSLA